MQIPSQPLKRIYQPGFTLIELIICLIVLSLIAMIAVPNYFEMRERGRQAMVVENMKIVQLAIEAFATDFGGCFPSGVNNRIGGGFAFYFPGGDEELQTQEGTYPKNPYTGLHMMPGDFMSFPYPRKPGDNRDESIGGPNDVWMWPGMIRYGGWAAPPAPQEYCIVGGNADCVSIRIANKIIVFHN